MNALARTLATAWLLLIIYASLHPFTGWRDHGTPLLAYLSAPWPRYWTGFDLWLNVAGYLPFGFFSMAALLGWRQRLNVYLPAWLGALLLLLWVTFWAALLSLTMETAQNFLPNRVPSNLDLATNVLGGLLGALIGLGCGRILAQSGPIHRWRLEKLETGAAGDVGLVILLAWLICQFSPEILLFGTGDLRWLIGVSPALEFNPERFVVVELLVAAGGSLSAGLFLWRLLRQPKRWLLPLLILLALAIRTGAAVILMSPEDSFGWLTPGNMVGLGWGVFLLLAATWLPRRAQTALAALAIILTTTLVNLAPENPYLIHSLKVWRQGHFLNFNGLTHLASSLWPHVALVFLIAIGPPREKPPHDRRRHESD